MTSEEKLSLLINYMDYYIDCLPICLGVTDDVTVTYNDKMEFIETNFDLIFGTHKILTFDQYNKKLNHYE